MKYYWYLLTLLVAVVLLVTGHMDLDWMVVAPRFETWYFSVDYWEFAPWLKMQWWTAYAYTAIRIAMGWLLLGWTLNEIKHKVDSS